MPSTRIASGRTDPRRLRRVGGRRGVVGGSTYDVSYVALAEALGIPLVTADQRLARAADPYCAVILID